jgi:zinc transporter ZupT
VAAAAADAQLEQLPLLDASSKSSSKQDQLFKASVKHSEAHSIGTGGAYGSRKMAADSSVLSTDPDQQQSMHQQQQTYGMRQQQQQNEQQHGQQQQQQQQQEADEVERLRKHHAGMLRLGLLMTITLTIHNLPEGFAVAFSAFTNIGPIMALAIGKQ